jgi:hypothetical protein
MSAQMASAPTFSLDKTFIRDYLSKEHGRSGFNLR